MPAYRSPVGIHNIGDTGDLSSLPGEGHKVTALQMGQGELSGPGHELLEASGQPVIVGVNAHGSRWYADEVPAVFLGEHVGAGLFCDLSCFARYSGVPCFPGHVSAM